MYVYGNVSSECQDTKNACGSCEHSGMNCTFPSLLAFRSRPHTVFWIFSFSDYVGLPLYLISCYLAFHISLDYLSVFSPLYTPQNIKAAKFELLLRHKICVTLCHFRFCILLAHLMLSISVGYIILSSSGLILLTFYLKKELQTVIKRFTIIFLTVRLALCLWDSTE
jgi:hypothetical protein